MAEGVTNALATAGRRGVAGPGGILSLQDELCTDAVDACPAAPEEEPRGGAHADGHEPWCAVC